MKKNPLDHIDGYVLRGCQKFSDLLHDWFNVSNFTIARFCLVLSLAFSIVYKITFYILHGQMLWLVIGVFFEFIFFLIGLGIIYFMESMVPIHSESGENPLKESFERWRPILLLLVIFFCFTIIESLCNIPEKYNSKEQDVYIVEQASSLTSHISFLLFMYFIGCQKRPKKKSKIQKLKESIEEKIEALMPKPELATIKVT